MNRKSVIVLIIGVLLVSAVNLAACSERTLESITDKAFDSIVLIIKKPQTTMSPLPVAQGLCIADDTVITVLDYDDVVSGKCGPGSLGVLVTATEFRIQAADSQTGATILIIPGMENEPCKTGDAARLKSGRKVAVIGWAGPEVCRAMLAARVVGSPEPSSVFFTVKITEEDAAHGWIPTPGAVVTDMEGNILGLVKSSFNRDSPSEPTLTVITMNHIKEWLSQEGDTHN